MQYKLSNSIGYIQLSLTRLRVFSCRRSVCIRSGPRVLPRPNGYTSPYRRQTHPLFYLTPVVVKVFERGLKAIPLSVDLWIHYLTYVRTTRTDDEDFIRSQFERALAACGLEFRSDRLWDGYIKWETEGKRLQNVTSIYDRLLATPTQGYTTHFDKSVASASA